MTEKISLEVSEEMVRRAEVTAKRIGKDVESVLTAWLERGSRYDVETLIEPNVEYPIYTPFGNEAAAQVLLDGLKAHRANKAKNDV